VIQTLIAFMKFRPICIPLFLFLLAICSCKKEYSYELNSNPATGTLQTDSDGTCMAKTVNGLFVAKKALNSSNYIEVTVNVTSPGSYFISTDTLNGFYFRGTGNFTSGNNTIKLTASGTPVIAGTSNFLISFDSSSCYVPVTVLPEGTTEAIFTLVSSADSCIDAVVSGTYIEGTIMNLSNKVDIKVNVTQPGAYTIATTAVNGISFSGSGIFTTTGEKTITLTASGTPVTAGDNVVSISAGSSSCTFTVKVKAVSLFDYFPRTANSNWSYQFDDNPDDSLLVIATPQSLNANGNTYTIFMETNNAALGYDSSGYYRKSGSNYYRYYDIGTYLGLTTAIWVEDNFLNDNVNSGASWTGTTYPADISGIGQISLRSRFTILQKDVTITVLGTDYANTIVVNETIEGLLAGVWTDLSTQIGSIKQYYARNIGLIKTESLDVAGTTSFKQELRRYQVF